MKVRPALPGQAAPEGPTIELDVVEVLVLVMVDPCEFVVVMVVGLVVWEVKVAMLVDVVVDCREVVLVLVVGLWT